MSNEYIIRYMYEHQVEEFKRLKLNFEINMIREKR